MNDSSPPEQPAPDNRGTYIDTHGLPDACPSCVVNVELPYLATPTDAGHHAAYGCSDCGHFWTTSWGR